MAPKTCLWDAVPLPWYVLTPQTPAAPPLALGWPVPGPLLSEILTSLPLHRSLVLIGYKWAQGLGRLGLSVGECD